jgi:hypothetical protein
MKTEIKVRYYWREVSDDGLLKEVRHSYYYDSVTLGSYGYDTEEEALEDLKYWCDAYRRMHSEFVMIKTYKVVEDYK